MRTKLRSWARAAAALIPLAAASSAARACNMTFPAERRVEAPTGPASGVRVYLAPWITGSPSGWNDRSLGAFVPQLRADGHELVKFSLPWGYPCLFEGDGMEYRRAYQAYLRRLVGELPPARKSIIGGISYGGLHALMGFALLPGAFDGWFALAPATKVGAVREFAGLAPSGFDPFQEAERLRRSPGLLTWGSADDRVDYRLLRSLRDSIGGGNLTSVEHPGIRHEIPTEALALALEWVNARR